MLLLVLRSITAALAIAATVPAQCHVDGLRVHFHFGAFCNVGPTGWCTVPPVPTTLSLGFDRTNCAIDVDIQAFEGCGVVVLARVVVIGSGMYPIWLPQFGPDCALWVQPIGFGAQVAAHGSIPLPPSMPQGSIFLAQAGALIFDPFGPHHLVVTFTNGLAAELL